MELIFITNLHDLKNYHLSQNKAIHALTINLEQNPRRCILYLAKNNPKLYIYLDWFYIEVNDPFTINMILRSNHAYPLTNVSPNNHKIYRFRKSSYSIRLELLIFSLYQRIFWCNLFYIYLIFYLVFYLGIVKHRTKQFKSPYLLNVSIIPKKLIQRVRIQSNEAICVIQKK